MILLAQEIKLILARTKSVVSFCSERENIGASSEELKTYCEKKMLQNFKEFGIMIDCIGHIVYLKYVF